MKKHLPQGAIVRTQSTSTVLGETIFLMGNSKKALCPQYPTLRCRPYLRERRVSVPAPRKAASSIIEHTLRLLARHAGAVLPGCQTACSHSNITVFKGTPGLIKTHISKIMSTLLALHTPTQRMMHWPPGTSFQRGDSFHRSG